LLAHLFFKVVIEQVSESLLLRLIPDPIPSATANPGLRIHGECWPDQSWTGWEFFDHGSIHGLLSALSGSVSGPRAERSQ
jgi:hypothetical protein